MTERNGQNGPKDNPEKSVQDTEPVVSKPYIMPDDPEEGSVEALTKEATEARDKMLRTLAEMENLRKRTTREVADARMYGITGFARDVLDIADNLQRALDARKARFETYVIEDACRGIDTQGSLAKAWADMDKAGVKRIQSSDIAA